MKGLATLIKLHKRQLDEIRRKMANLENQKRELEEALRNLAADLEREKEAIRGKAEMASYFGSYAKRVRARQEQTAQAIRMLDEQIDKHREEINIAFGELKKFEIAEANAKKRAAAEERRKETIELDDIGGQQHQRKKKNEPV